MQISLLLTLLTIPSCQAFTYAPKSIIDSAHFLSSSNEINKVSPIRSITSLKMSAHTGARKLNKTNSSSNVSPQNKFSTKSLFGLRSVGAMPNQNKWIQKMTLRMKNVMTVFFTASLIFLGAASLRTAPSHASSLAASKESSTRLVSTQAIMSSTEKLDTIIQEYVEKHMFDEEKFDHFESTIREAYSDQISGTNPVKEILTKEKMLVDGLTKAVKSTSIFSKIKSIPRGITNVIVNWAEANTSLDPKLIKMIVAVSTVTVVPVAFLYSFLSFGGIFRKGMMRGEVSRYGNRKDLTAIEKEEKDDDEEEEDDDDDDDDDDGE